MKRTLLCAFLALFLLLTVGCGQSAAPSASSGVQSSSGAASSAGTSSGTTDTIPEFEMPDYSIGLLDNGFYKGVTALDHVTLPALEGIVIPKDIQTVAEADVQAEIDAMLESYAYTEEIRDRAVENGDLVNIDYVGRIDGVAFDGGNTQGAGTTVTAGSTAYIDDFLTQIIGAKPGDTVMVEVTFPTPYANNPDLAGKDAVFETVINYIEGDTVIPELTDAFVQENLQERYASAAEMKEDIRQLLRKDQVTAYVLEELYAKCSFNQVPEKLVDDQCAFMRTDLSNMAYYNGTTLSMVLSYYGWSSLEDAYAANRADFLMYIEQYLMCQAVAEKLNMVVDDAAIESYFANVVGGGASPTAYTSYYGKGYVAQDVLVDMVTTYLLDNAVYQ